MIRLPGAVPSRDNLGLVVCGPSSLSLQEMVNAEQHFIKVNPPGWESVANLKMCSRLVSAARCGVEHSGALYRRSRQAGDNIEGGDRRESQVQVQTG